MDAEVERRRTPRLQSLFTEKLLIIKQHNQRRSKQNHRSADGNARGKIRFLLEKCCRCWPKTDKTIWKKNMNKNLDAHRHTHTPMDDCWSASYERQLEIKLSKWSLYSLEWWWWWLQFGYILAMKLFSSCIFLLIKMKMGFFVYTHTHTRYKWKKKLTNRKCRQTNTADGFEWAKN